MKERPVNLNILTLRFPITAWVSIAHRLSGIFLIFLIPLLLWGLQESLASPERFQALRQYFTQALVKIALWIFLSALFYHWLAGIRHLLLDVHVGESKSGGKRGAKLLILFAIAGSLLLGVFLW